METELLSVLGKTAGIGGVALGVMLILFREFIRKNIFPTLTKTQSYNLLKLFLFLIFGIAVLGIAAWVYVDFLRNNDVAINKDRPTLIFKYTDDNRWLIENVGKSFAKKIVISHMKERENEWSLPTRIPPLKPGGVKHLNWVGHPDKLGTSYDDEYGIKYYTLTNDDRYEERFENFFPVWADSEIEPDWKR